MHIAAHNLRHYIICSMGGYGALTADTQAEIDAMADDFSVLFEGVARLVADVADLKAERGPEPINAVTALNTIQAIVGGHTKQDIVENVRTLADMYYEARRDANCLRAGYDAKQADASDLLDKADVPLGTLLDRVKWLLARYEELISLRKLYRDAHKELISLRNLYNDAADRIRAYAASRKQERAKMADAILALEHDPHLYTLRVGLRRAADIVRNWKGE